MTNLYTLTQVNIETGEKTVIYGHATENVMSEFWEAYTDENHFVEISLYPTNLTGIDLDRMNSFDPEWSDAENQ